MRKPLIAGNWKLFGSPEMVRSYLAEFSVPEDRLGDREILICPPFTVLPVWNENKSARPYIMLGAQDVYWESEGAFTGEVAPRMLKDAGCSHCIVGHSERRAMFGDTDGTVNRKMNALMAEGLVPVVCVGETLEEREAGDMEKVLTTQVTGSVLASKDSYDLAGIVVAYEPVWAIGTGKTATPQQANEAVAFVRSLLEGGLGEKAEAIRILYGGSVKPGNIDELMAQPEVDGVLVGGASLKPGDFSQIAAYNKYT